MTCRDCRALLAAWVDDELPGRDAEAVSLHLAGCAGCRGIAERDRRFVRALRASFAGLAAPAGLRQRMLALARGNPPPPRRRLPGRRRAGLAMAAGGVLAAALGLWTLHDRTRAEQEWCRTFVDDHLESVLAGPRLELATRSPARLSRWFARTMRQRVSVPALADATLLGGRRCVLKGHTVGMAVYAHAGKQISLFVTDDPAVSPPGWKLDGGRTHVVTELGHALAAWRAHGVLRVVVGALPAAALRRLIPPAGPPRA